MWDRIGQYCYGNQLSCSKAPPPDWMGPPPAETAACGASSRDPWVEAEARPGLAPPPPETARCSAESPTASPASSAWWSTLEAQSPCGEATEVRWPSIASPGNRFSSTSQKIVCAQGFKPPQNVLLWQSNQQGNINVLLPAFNYSIYITMPGFSVSMILEVIAD